MKNLKEDASQDSLSIASSVIDLAVKIVERILHNMHGNMFNVNEQMAIINDVTL